MSGNEQRLQHLPWRARARRAKKGTLRLQRRIETALATGDRHKARKLQDVLLKSQAGKIVSLEIANKKIAPVWRVSRREALSRSAEVCPFRGTGEVVRVFTKIKKNGRLRTLHSYGLINRAIQYLALMAVRPFTTIDTRSYLQVGRDAAVQRALDLIRNGSWRWVCEIDVTDFYPNINREKLVTLLPLDRRVIEVAITSIGANRLYRRTSRTTGRSESAHQGLPQGAATSPFVADSYVASLLDS
jgi:hypothetical protein